MRRFLHIFIGLFFLCSCEDDVDNELLQEDIEVQLLSDFKVGITDKSFAQWAISDFLNNNSSFSASSAENQDYEARLDFERGIEVENDQIVQQYIPIKSHSNEVRNLVIKGESSYIYNYSYYEDETRLRITDLGGQELSRFHFNHITGEVISQIDYTASGDCFSYELECTEVTANSVTASEVYVCKIVQIETIECGNEGGGGGSPPPPSDTPPSGGEGGGGGGNPPPDDGEEGNPPDEPDDPATTIDPPPSDDPTICIGGWDCDDVPELICEYVDDCDEEENRRRECQKMEDIATNYPNYINAVQQLQSYNTGNVEHYVALEGDTVTTGQGTPNAVPIPAPTTAYTSLSHNHPSGNPNNLAVFSIDDLFAIAIASYYNQIDDGPFVAYLTTHLGTELAFTITDATKLENFFMAYIADRYDNSLYSSHPQEVVNSQLVGVPLILDYFGYEDQETGEKKSGKIDQAETSENQLESFLEFLNQADLGISLFESTDNFNTLSEITLKNGEIIYKLC